MGPTHVNGEEVDPLIGWCLTYFTNFSGHPSISVPAGLSGGLPVGMQLIGRPQADADVLAAAATFERLQPWRDHYRICAERKLIGGHVFATAHIVHRWVRSDGNFEYVSVAARIT